MAYSIYWPTVNEDQFCVKYQENKYLDGSQTVLRKPL
ncbi:hypothetical protein J2772_000360 [Chryseobacterium jejuense]|nr:hypothetical protein [Chryseobacterium jejuense]